MSHPLTDIVSKWFTSNEKTSLDSIITTYLKGRAKWLKERGCVYRTDEGVDRAFELDEKCEPIYGICSNCGEKMEVGTVEKIKPQEPKYCECKHGILASFGKCVHCGLPFNPKPTLPSKFGYSPKENSLTNELCKAINQLIDYLHSKEAR